MKFDVEISFQAVAEKMAETFFAEHCMFEVHACVCASFYRYIVLSAIASSYCSRILSLSH